MTCLIVGLGIGQLYRSVFSSLGHMVHAIDPDPKKNAQYTDVDQIAQSYDIAVICTPNYTHEYLARSVAKFCDIVLIEKPGLQNSAAWQQLVHDFPKTRFMMVKNNQYRKEITEFKISAGQSRKVEVIWNNKNRIPHPGGWFTDKKLSFGGVSRDLIPHMLSYYTCLTNYANGQLLNATAKQRHQLANIVNTDYGIVNKDGIFDVDDFARLEYQQGNTHWTLSADWKNDLADDVYINFDNGYKFLLGLCPEEAYKVMIATAYENLNNDEFWNAQYKQDIWIHQQLEKL